MFEKDSPQDLLLLGFSREYILDKTGTDVGYHGNAMKKELKGIDRVSYKVEFVKSNYTNDEIATVLDEYAAGIDAATVLDRLGLAGVNIIKLNVLFKGLGLSDEFKDADKKHRKGIMKQGMLDKYGVDNPFKLDEFQAIAAETRKEKYGAEYTLASGSVLSDGARATFAEHMQDDAFRKELNEKKCATNTALYGVPYVVQSPVFQAKMNATKHKNGMFNSSNIEECIKALDIFKSQYKKDVRYPYLCDFYDKDKDLFIEVNASWTHNFHWYDVDSDAVMVNVWKKKSDDSQYYASALKIFTKSDVEKRECARKNNLNYVTLWDSDGMDADLWFAMGMPLGKDWEREYSWLPYHYIPEEVDVQNMHLSWRSLSAIVKDAQRKVFYKRELELWNNNPLRNGKWGTVQAFLYANRYKYLNKLPHELTDRMLLRSFRISGLHMGYTSFNSSLMRQVIEKYNVKSVYDPCAGWGERMMTCGKLGVSYEGCDINSELFEGYKKLYELIDGFKPVLHNNDSANQLVTGDADAIITCPPYKNIEVYSDNGAENLSDEDFAAWWSDVVKNCSYSNAKVFAVQTNQACRSVFMDALVAHGWQLKEELLFDNNQKSHFHRVSGMTKREYESMLVFTR
jgi:parB-like protein